VLAEGSARVEREGALPEAVTRSLEELLPNLRPSPGDTSERPELVAGAEPEKPRTHALAWTLFAASGVAAGFAIYGAARVAQVEGAINAVNGPGVSASVYQANLGTALGGANAQNWQWAAIALGAVSVAAAVSGVLTW
jgi:aryl-alcohol dehydrogenase-like predicted oxidoreductase